MHSRDYIDFDIAKLLILLHGSYFKTYYPF